MLLFSTAFAAPNVLLVVVDDLGVDKVSAYADDVSGYRAAASHLPDTAALDDLAAAGVRFTQAWANPLCSPTRAGILTGRHAYRTGVGYPVPIGDELDVTSEVTLATTLSAAGYATGLFGKWHLGDTGSLGTTEWSLGNADVLEVAESSHPIRAGFDVFRGSLSGQVEDYWSWTYVQSEPDYTRVETSTTYATWQTVDDALDWILARSGPWFAMVSLNAAHTDGTDHAYDADDADALCHDHTCLESGTCDDLDRTAMQALTECADAGIAELLGGLDPATLSDTVVIVVGDNGTESFVMEGDYATTGSRTTNGKSTAYQTGVRVPLLVADGANYLERLACEASGTTCAYSAGAVTSPGRRVDTPVGTVDLYATIASLGGADASTAVDAVSFGSCLTSTSSRCVSTSRTLYTEAFTLAPSGAPTFGVAAIRSQQNKLVARYDASGGCFTYELYSLQRDPFERRNLAAVSASATTLTTLKASLTALAVPWMSGVGSCS